MANGTQALTHQLIARKAAKILVEQNTVMSNINLDREVEFERDTNGYTVGETVRVKIPPTPKTYSGSNFAGGGAAPSMTETSVNLTVDQQVHVPIMFTAKEKKLEVTDFENRFLRPAMNALISDVNRICLLEMKNRIATVLGTSGTVPATRTPWRNASSALDRFLAPGMDRSAHFSIDASDALAEANATLFSNRSEIDNQFKENSIGRFAELDFYKQLSLPVHVNGAGTGYLVNGAGQTGSTLAVNTGTGAITRGSVFTLPGVNATHPVTGQDAGVLRQFVVTTDYAGGAGNISIFPAITLTSASVVGTVTALPTTTNALTFVGAASTSRRQNIVFHKDAFASAFVPLPVLASCEGYTATMKNISVRVMSFGDGKLDQENTRIDVLFALPAAIRADHAARVTE